MIYSKVLNHIKLLTRYQVTGSCRIHAIRMLYSRFYVCYTYLFYTYHGLVSSRPCAYIYVYVYIISCLFTVFMLMMENCFWNVKKIRKNVYDIIISPIYYKTGLFGDWEAQTSQHNRGPIEDYLKSRRYNIAVMYAGAKGPIISHPRYPEAVGKPDV